MVSSSSSLLPSRSRLKDGGVRLQQQRQRHRASGLREEPTRRARLRPRPRRLGGLPRAGGTLSEEEEQELLLSEEVFERKGCMLLVSTPTQRPRPDDSAFHFVHQSSADSSRAALCTVSSLSRQGSASSFAFRVKKKGKEREESESERETIGAQKSGAKPSPSLRSSRREWGAAALVTTRLGPRFARWCRASGFDLVEALMPRESIIIAPGFSKRERERGRGR